MRIHPYRPLTPPAAEAARVSCPPYDVITESEGRALLARQPESFLAVTRPECAQEPGRHVSRRVLHAAAAERLAAMRARGRLVREPEAALYVYRLRAGTHEQTGLAGLFDVRDYESGILRKHEHTRIETEKERAQHIRTLRAQTGLVFLAYRGHAGLEAALAEETGREPWIDFVADDGVRHSLWRIVQADAVQACCREIPAAYIADGHHRAAAGARAARELSAGGEAMQMGLQAVLFPAAQLRILPYHRLLHDLGGLTPGAFLEAMRSRFEVTLAADGIPPRAGCLRLYLDGRWYSVTHLPDPAAPLPDRLDVAVLQDRLLAPVLGIRQPRKDPRLSFVGGVEGAAGLQRRVDRGEAVAAWALYPTRIEDLMAVADAGLVMPPKSTWFEPKLRSGLLVYAGA